MQGQMRHDTKEALMIYSAMLPGEHHAEGRRVASKTRTKTVEWDCTCGKEPPTKVTIS